MRCVLIGAISVAQVFLGTNDGSGIHSQVAVDCARDFYRHVVDEQLTEEATARILSQFVSAREESGPALLSLPIKIYRAEYSFRRPSVLAWLTVDGNGKCRLIAGDLEEILGVPFGWESAFEYGLIEYNASLEGARLGGFVTDEERVNYVVGVLSAVMPEAKIVLLRSVEDIPMADARQKNDHTGVLPREVATQVHPPSVQIGKGTAKVTFLTWENPGGVVMRNEVYLSPDGRVAPLRVPIVSHVGAFEPYVSRF